jgi:putative Ig domain-containing protein
MKKKATSKKSGAKKSKKQTTTKKSTAKKAAAKKTTAKRSAPKKSAGKKTVAMRIIGRRSALTFLTESLPAFQVGRPTTTRIQAVGGATPYSFGISQGTLPLGLYLNYMGTLYGQPIQSGDTTIFVKVTDFVGAHLTQAFDLQVMGPQKG